MSFQWTEEQENVIRFREGNLLVSAAAGSGKTAVLVEHLLSRMLDPDHPADADRFLVVTFTKAAAAEMRRKLLEALEKRAEAHPEDANIRRQIQLVPNAQVSTIDSFCAEVIRSHIALLDIDPAFRVGDEGEMKLLQEDVLSDLLSDEYDRADPAFLHFTETASAGKDDRAAGAWIMELYRFSRSSAYPDRWLASCLEGYAVPENGDLTGKPWFTRYAGQLTERAEKLLRSVRERAEYIRAQGGPQEFLDHALEEEAGLEAVLEAAAGCAAPMENAAAGCAAPAGDGPDGAAAPGPGHAAFDLFEARILELPDQANSRKSAFGGVSKEAVARIKEMRSAYRTGVKELKSMAAGMNARALSREIRLMAPFVRELVRLTRAFSDRYQAEKKKKQLADFGDLSRFAIEILVKDDGSPSDAARALSRRFDEILIDEYQDSNDVQELILTAVSRETDGHPNIFMVGDMKQSIYRFRMARPELFVEKYRRYSRTSGPYRKIELHSNFRSRREVIDSVNRLFRLLMQEEVGNIEYTEEAALHPGLAFPPYPEGYTGSPETEVLCLDPTAEEEGQADAGDVGNDVLEALMTGQKIREILSPERGLAVLDGGRYRRAEPKDITILMRSRSRFETFRDTLESMDIPCVIDDAGSFYISMEVTLVLNLLSVLDNPLNDIPLASLLQSVLYRFTDSELAEIRAYGREKDARGGFLFALKAYEGPLMPRIERFLRDMERYRRLAGTLSVSGLVRAIYEETGLPGLMAAFPGGAVRRKNLYSLLYRAEDFEKTSYQGIFNFIRYVEKRLKLDTDEPAAQAAAENAVTIQTIHKSKGLQYPIVFVCGCGGKLNASDETGDVLMDQDFGIGVRTVDVRRRVKKDSFLRQAIQGKIRADSRGEELRVLYVAMTRAQEKLILTGVHKPSKEEMKTVEETGAPKQYVSREERKELVLTKGSYMEWIRGVVREAGIRYSEPGAADVAAAGLREEAGNRALRAAFEAGIETLTRGSADTLGRRFAFPYIYDDLYRTAPTSSVSALKARHLEEMEAEGGIPWHAPALTEEGADGPEESGEAGEGAPSGGRPGKAGRRLTGAEIGTAYHLVFRYLPETGPVSELLSRLCGEGLILPEEKATINIGKIEAFRDSSVGRRFFRANREGKGFRERPFVIGVPVTDPVPGEAEVRRKSPADPEVRRVSPEEERRENPEEVRRESPADPEFRMIQGVIDLYFEEPDGLVIADYKTDRVKDGAELVRRYRIQLELYKQALEQATGKTVKECWIYSTSLGEEIRVL